MITRTYEKFDNDLPNYGVPMVHPDDMKKQQRLEAEISSSIRGDLWSLPPPLFFKINVRYSTEGTQLYISTLKYDREDMIADANDHDTVWSQEAKEHVSLEALIRRGLLPPDTETFTAETLAELRHAEYKAMRAVVKVMANIYKLEPVSELLNKE